MIDKQAFDGGRIAASGVKVPSFRKDINFIRATAVVAVVLFHYKVFGFAGGYVGVDIFFVISGFLMTRIIVGRLQEHRFGFLRFYAARFDRIVPALFGLCVALLVFGIVLLDPLALKQLCRHIIGSLGFYSNVQYYQEAGYFDRQSDLKWLLHTWSLSVEWQFYILYPVVLAAAWKVAPSLRLLRMLIWLGCGVSLALCIVTPLAYQSAAFYLLPTRAWEMLAGGLVALHPVVWSREGTSRALQVASLAVLLFCIVGFDAFMPWPSYRATLPVAATCLFLLANRSSSQLVAFPAAQLLGDWSYAIYLWHWPIAVAIHYFSLPVPPVAAIGLLALMVLMGRFVQRTRFSDMSWQGSGRLGLIVMIGAVAGLSGYAVRNQGLQERRPDRVAVFADLAVASSDWAFPAHCERLEQDRVLRGCQQPGGTRGDILFLGDSIAEAIYGRWAGRAGIARPNLTFVTQGGCPILPGAKRRGPGEVCGTFLDHALSLAEMGAYRRVVVTSLWSGYFRPGETVCFVEGNRCADWTAETLPGQLDASMGRLKERLERVRRSGAEVVILLTYPFSSVDVPQELAKRLYLGQDTTDVQSIDLGAFRRLSQPIHDRLRAVAQEIGAEVLDPAPWMCEGDVCPAATAAMRPLYRDQVHLRWSVIQGRQFDFLDRLVRPFPQEMARPRGE
ncbi:MULTISPECIES: acyltransferase family protein [Methylobacterium]|uniref:acyltransferase family protein n=1 Tax=Methylobacterium TaxID=407 RepID=UPI0009EA1186|nr:MULTISPECIES: acyltransferase family protein [Methylobacterium]MCI9880885.1 acyltransferase [Methylobacterium goesingense]